MLGATWGDGVREWLARARRLVDGRDLKWLTPLGVLRLITESSDPARIAALSQQAAADVNGDGDLAARDEELVELLLDAARALGNYYFRLECRGVEHVPPAGSALLVGNHNGAIMPLDSFFTMLAVRDRHGKQRVVHPLAHQGLFTHPASRGYALRLGALYANHRGAERALYDGRLVLVYPGSDWDASRRFAERHRIELGGRHGFLKLTLRTGAPIVPVVSTGTHEQLIILTRGQRLARALGLKERLGMNTLPIALGLPWGLFPAIIPYLPLPAQTTVAFGPPIRFPGLGPQHADDESVLRRCYDEVTARMQALLDGISAGRRPFLGQPGYFRTGIRNRRRGGDQGRRAD